MFQVFLAHDMINNKKRYVDPRYYQIITLSSLLLLQIYGNDFGPNLSLTLITVLSAIITQALFTAVIKSKQGASNKNIPLKFDPRSPLITALSLTILLKSSVLWIHPLATIIAISSKFLLRLDKKHIFNPANIGIVVMLIICPSHSWISPGQWGSSAWLGLLLICLAFLVLYSIPRRDMGPMFLALWTILLVGRAVWLNDPFTIPLHQLQNGALLIFAFFMISDPKTIPDHIWGRFIFALAVAVCGFILQFQFQIREGLFYALSAICILRPFIDRTWKARAYNWKRTSL